MRPKTTTRPVLSVLALLFLTAGLLAGCGGGGAQPEGGSDAGQQEGGQQEGQQGNAQARESKIGVGNVVSVNSERRRMVVRPSQQAEGAGRLAFKIRKNAEITLGGRGAEMGDIAEDQQAQVEYVVVNNVNRATSVQLFEAAN